MVRVNIDTLNQALRDGAVDVVYAYDGDGNISTETVEFSGSTWVRNYTYEEGTTRLLGIGRWTLQGS